ncbi:hypothetical protein Tsubulata_031456 [Turnera subulata]|uniref:Pentacotripeptide-repeat region of PRORP domain-containing protein n=1 Tax=Turnera subulata TaxID=218843 RepID=A0A9Q0JC77_9ROSI|nr:hypothetical protein Tsubulata_031456 [Turnera subulata]
MDEWVQEGKHVKHSHLQKSIKRLRKQKRFSQALEILDWICHQRNSYGQSSADLAFRLDLTAKVHGLDQAEKCFDSIPDYLRNFQVYGALLNCYAHYRCLEKAEALMQKMRELGFLNTLPCNVMLNLYSRLGKHESLDTLMQEMEKNYISFDKFTYSICLSAYAAASNIEGMEKLLAKMESDPSITLDWQVYASAASGYLKAGLIDKTLTMLKASESLVWGNSRNTAYESLINLYTDVGNKDEVCRLWNLYRDTGKLLNSGYACIINALVKLDDIDGPEQIAEEWLLNSTIFDMRIPKLIISAYSKKGLWEKAEAYISKAIIKSGTELDAGTWDRLAIGYHIGGQMPKAIETMKKAVSISKPGWKPNVYTLAACLEYLKVQDDAPAAEELLKITHEHCHFSPAIYSKLENCLNKGTLRTEALDETEGDDRIFPGETAATKELRDKDQTASIIPVVHKWLEEGNNLTRSKLQFIIKQLRKFHRFNHALEVSQWMDENKPEGYVQSSGDLAIRLDLLSKVHGLEEAERFFDAIPDHLRSSPVYGALLNSYVHERCLEKAEAHLQKMRELGFLDSPLPYNVMLSFYSKMGKYEEMNVLMQEMGMKAIDFDLFTYNIQLNAYVTTSNVEEIEKVLMRMEADPLITMDWNAYATAAKGYLKAGLVDKAVPMLRRSEQLIRGKDRKLAYEIILTSYAAAGNKEEVYRVWNLCKLVGKFHNSSYLSMVSALLKLDDVEGAESIWDEWLSVKKTFVDIRIPNVVIAAYSKKGLWEKAEACVNKMVDSGIEPREGTLDRLAIGYQVGGQMEKAIDTIKRAISMSKPGWKPYVFTLCACLGYLKDQGDVQQADELLKKIQEHCNFPKGIYKKLKYFAENGSRENRSTDQLEDDGESLNKEIYAKEMCSILEKAYITTLKETHPPLYSAKMKLLCLRPNHRHGGISRLLKALFFSTNTPYSSTSSAPAGSLYRSVSLVQEPTATVIPIVEKWLKEDNNSLTSQLKSTIKQLRKDGRFSHALQISQWMAENALRGFVQSSGDYAIHLELISRVHGLTQAEKYFDTIPLHSRSYHVHGALLSCYASNKDLEKAEAQMQKMRESGLLNASLPYNIMLNLYSQKGKHEKLDVLLQEMEKIGIRYDKVTYNILLNAYAATPSVEQMEKLWRRMEGDPLVTIDWQPYVTAANAYLKAGLIDKAVTMLRRSEKLAGYKTRRRAYESILNSYAAAGNKDEVYRVWNLCKRIKMFSNSSYLCVISALSKVNDIDGAESVWEEWLSVEKKFVDIRVPNLMITAFAKKGLWEKAEECVTKMTDSGIEPGESTLDCLATGYSLGGQMEKAIETVKKAISMSKPGWRPNKHTLAACLRYLKEQVNVQVANELLAMVQEHCHFSDASYSTLKCWADTGTLNGRDIDQMKNDQNLPSLQLNRTISRVPGLIRALYYSTNSSSYPPPPPESLYGRISRAGGPKVSILPIIQDWVQEGNGVNKQYLKNTIKQLRKFRRYAHALEVSHWMCDQWGHQTPGDIAVQLDLFSKVYGLEKAEEFFNGIPDHFRNFQVYGALLSCYSHHQCLDRAEALMEKMRDLGFVQTLAYNLMLNLYSKMGKHEKLDMLMQEMEERGITFDMYTYNTRLNDYVATSNIEGMEKLLSKMEADPHITVTWYTYAVAAHGYKKAGLLDKSLTILKKSEPLIRGESRWNAYESLLNSYTALGKKDEVYRIWNLYKSTGRFFNSLYLWMINCLIKLEDLDGAEKIFEEWLSSSKKSLFDVRILNAMINAYCKKGLWEKAEAYVNKIVGNGIEVDARSWVILADGYHSAGQMTKAVESVRKALAISRQGWKPNVSLLVACLNFLKLNGDVEVAEELLKVLMEHCQFDGDTYDRLKNCIDNGNPSTGELEEKTSEMLLFPLDHAMGFKNMLLFYPIQSQAASPRMLLLRSRQNRELQTHVCSKVIGALFSSTATATPKDSLDRRIWLTKNPTASVIPVIEKWVQEGKKVDNATLHKSIKLLRNKGRFSHALQISQWLGHRFGKDLSTGNIAIQLDLISKVNGLEEAENYFEGIPAESRGYQVYGALLNCYARHKHLEKAEATMEKMRKLGLMQTLAYNVMLNLYSEMGKLEKLDELMQEMEEKGIPFDIYTFNTRLSAYVTTSDIKGMEKLLLRMEADPVITTDWNAYIIAANGFLKAGLIENAVAMMHRSEKLIRGNSKYAYEQLLTLHAAAGNKDEVYRLWNIYKCRGWSSSFGYLCMIASLMRLEDYDGAEMIWEEWLSATKTYDARIPAAMINVYSRKGLVKNAEAIVNKSLERGIKLTPTSWDHLASGYCRSGHLVKATETMEKAILISKPGWKPTLHTLAACLNYLDSQGDVKAKEELLKLAKEHCRFSETSYNKLTSGNLNTKSHDQVDDDKTWWSIIINLQSAACIIR